MGLCRGRKRIGAISYERRVGDDRNSTHGRRLAVSQTQRRRPRPSQIASLRPRRRQRKTSKGFLLGDAISSSKNSANTAIVRLEHEIVQEPLEQEAPQREIVAVQTSKPPLSSSETPPGPVRIRIVLPSEISSDFLIQRLQNANSAATNQTSPHPVEQRPRTRRGAAPCPAARSGTWESGP